jgi:hypothetical protein
MITIILLVLAFVCFLLAAAGVPSRVNFGWLGLALWVATQFVGVHFRVGM